MNLKLNAKSSIKRLDSKEDYITHIQPAFLIGTYNEDGSPNFCPITWVNSTWDGDHALMVISMNGAKKTKENIARTNLLSANLVSVDMLELLDYFGSCSGLAAPKNALDYAYEEGHVLRVPTLSVSRRVFECEVENTFKTSDTTTYFCRSRNCQQIEGLGNGYKEDTAMLEPVVYTGCYFTSGEYLGEMGDFYKSNK
jgi:flavin reductase (DIM6/NTAB) family NADH-FMN oxidoreductase RutF